MLQGREAVLSTLLSQRKRLYISLIRQSFNTDLCNSRLYKYLCVYTHIYILKLKTSFSVLFLTLFKIHTI